MQASRRTGLDVQLQLLGRLIAPLNLLSLGFTEKLREQLGKPTSPVNLPKRIMIAAICDRSGLAVGHVCYSTGAGLIPQMVLRVIQAKRLFLGSLSVVVYQHRKKMFLQFRIIIAYSNPSDWLFQRI